MQYPWSRPGSSREPHPHHNTLQPPGEMVRRDFSEPMETQQQNVPKKSKRFRSAFTTDQVNYLEMEFQKFPYIGSNERKEVANILNIPERAVKVWFQNRRMREKKELVGNSESDESNRNTIDLGHEEVNNSTLSLPPINAPPYSLPEVTVTPSVKHVAHIDLTNFEPNSSEAADSQDLNYYNDLIAPLPEVSISKVPKLHCSKPPVENSSQLKYRSSAEFSIDLCKKYKKFGVTELQSKTEDISLQSVPVTPPRVPPLVSIPKIEHQSSPEDLSYNKSSINKIQTPSPSKVVSPNSSGLVPVYVNYPQPYLSGGTMLWKPVNVVPIMSTGVPSNVPNVSLRPLPRPQEQSMVKRKCNCDCHVDTPEPRPDTSSNSQAQYVMSTFPFQNYPKF